MSEIKSVTVQLPINQDAEQAVLGALLIDPDAIYRILGNIDASDFYVAKNGWIYETYVELVNRGIKSPDYVTICDELARKDRLDEIGGAAYLTGLISQTPTALGIEKYADIVFRTSYLRKTIKTAGQIAQIGYEDNDVTIQEKQEQIERLVFGLAPKEGNDGLVHIKTPASELYDELDRRQKEGTKIGIPSGFHDIDALTGGFQKSDMIVVAARPSMGKTSLMLNMAHNAAKQGFSSAVFSLEMSARQLVQRLVSAEMGVNSNRLRTGTLKEDEWPIFIDVIGKLGESRIYIDDTPGISASQIRSKLRRLVTQEHIDLLIVDYLQLMQSDRVWKNVVAETTQVSKDLKGLAKEFDLPLVVGSQLSRACEQRNDKRPMLSDLRESGAIEQDADIVAFIYRDDYYDEESEYKGLAEILLKKHRNGPTGIATLGFRKNLAQFYNIVLEREDLNVY